MELNALVEAIMSSGSFSVGAAASILTLVYVLKLPALGGLWGRIPKPYRPISVATLGIVSGVADAIVTGKPWVAALISGIIAALSAIGADQVATKTARQQ